MLKTCTLLFGLFLASTSYCGEAAIASGHEEALKPAHIVMHKNPGCGCCDQWAEHIQSFGFTLETIEDPKILKFKAKRNIPGPLMSCHTAMVDGYFVEGHVPAQDILRLLKEKPEHITGIAVPGMPLGSPGMEHSRPQGFNTIALLTDGSAYVFESHVAGEDFSPGKKN